MADACAKIKDSKDCEVQGCVPASTASGADDGTVCQAPPAHCAVLSGARCMRCHDPYVIDSEGTTCEFQLPSYVPLALGGIGLLLLIVSEIAHHRNNNERARHREHALEEDLMRMEMSRAQPAVPRVVYAAPPASPPAQAMGQMPRR